MLKGLFKAAALRFPEQLNILGFIRCIYLTQAL
jgi:hypothetical protein